MKNLKKYMIIGVFFVIVTGTLFHFVYEWTGNNFFAGFFFPINESVWEHMKLIFFPMLLYSFIVNKKLKEDFPCISSSIYLGSIIGTFLIPIIYYAYYNITGYSIFLLDIIIFILSVIVAFIIAYKYTLSCDAKKYETLLNIIMYITGLLFIVFTYFPPDIELFISP